MDQDDLDFVVDKGMFLVKNVERSSLITYFGGNRAATYHEDFIIQCSDKLDNVIYAAGIQSPGLASSPAIAERVEHLLLGICPDIEKDENYNPVREEVNPFRFCSMEEREQRIKENPLYGRIICRCESVTEGEIVDAIHGKVPAVNIDAINEKNESGNGKMPGRFLSGKSTGNSCKRIRNSGNRSYAKGSRF